MRLNVVGQSEHKEQHDLNRQVSEQNDLTYGRVTVFDAFSDRKGHEAHSSEIRRSMSESSSRASHGAGATKPSMKLASYGVPSRL